MNAFLRIPVVIAMVVVTDSVRELNANDKIALFSTSFENLKVQPFKRLDINGVTLNAVGTVSINSKYSRDGKQCLHLLGDEDNSLVFHLPERLRKSRGISFHAERWTRRNPFAFSVDVLSNNQWIEIAKLDQVTLVGARFLSHIRLAIKEKSVTAIRFRVTAASKSGLLIDDLKLHASPPTPLTKIPTNRFPIQRLTSLDSHALFVSGTNETHTFRIPAIITATNGDIIVACDARRKSSADLGHQRTIDIVYRRSSDNGKTWSPMALLDSIDHGGCSDPSFVLDHETSEIFCFYNYMSQKRSNNEYRFFLQKSSDHGNMWNKPVDFTDSVAGPELKDAFKFVTSGRGIQTSDGTLLHNYVRVGKGLTIFGSVDHGKNWKSISTASPGDESKLVQLSDGSLMINSRIGPGRRHIHRSKDGGKKWTSDADYSLPDPRCNASILHYPKGLHGNKRNVLVFCNAASNSGRKNLAIRYSYDDGQTWSDGKVIDSGPSAYSELSILKDGSLGIVYEPGYNEIRFVRCSLAAVLEN